MKEADEKLDYFTQPNAHGPVNVTFLCQGWVLCIMRQSVKCGGVMGDSERKR